VGVNHCDSDNLGKCTSLAISPVCGFVYTFVFLEEMILSRYNPFNCQECQFITRRTNTLYKRSKVAKLSKVSRVQENQCFRTVLYNCISVFGSSYLVKNAFGQVRTYHYRRKL
jgi:hypothetical protein